MPPSRSNGPFFYMHVHVEVPQWVWVPCPVYCSGRGRHYIGNDVVDESH